MHSDLDLLVLTSEQVTEDKVQKLVNDTYPLFLEFGRQISPQFRLDRQLSNPQHDRDRRLMETISKEGFRLL